jgi:integrase
MFREPAGKTRFLSPEEEWRLCEKIGAPYAGWVRLAILTGMRQMEQFSLRWEHVDLERGVLTLPTTKAGGVQYVRLNEEAKMLLQRFIPGNKSVWVFPSENPDTHADPRNFYRRVYLPTVKAIGLEGVSWHSLRHTFASRLAMSGATEGTIATLLRHSGTILVRRYAHLSPSHLQNEVEKVAAFGKVADQQKGRKELTADLSEPGEPVGDAQPVEGQSTLISVPTVTGTVTGGK